MENTILKLFIILLRTKIMKLENIVIIKSFVDLDT